MKKLNLIKLILIGLLSATILGCSSKKSNDVYDTPEIKKAKEDFKKDIATSIEKLENYPKELEKLKKENKTK